MLTEKELREKIKKLEALFAGGATKGEKSAAHAAKERIINRLKEERVKEKDIEYTLRLSDVWSRKLLLALCKRYDITPYRKYRQKYTTVMIKAPERFINEVLWPEYTEISKVLREYLDETTNKIISQEIFENPVEIEVIEDSKQITSKV